MLVEGGQEQPGPGGEVCGAGVRDGGICSSSTYTGLLLIISLEIDKGTVSVISMDPPYKDDNVRFTMIPLKALSWSIMN